MRRSWLIPLLVMLAVGLPFMVSWWARWDSAVHASVAWRMALTGDYLGMYAGESVYFNKPPLAIWVLAGVFRAGLASGLLSADAGPPVWLVRAPSLVAALLCVRVLVATVQRTHGQTAAVAAGWVIALTQPFFVLLNEKVVDFWQALCIACVLWCWVRGTGGGAGGWRWVLLSGVAMGLALLCKPAGALLAVPVGAVWLGVTGRWRLLAALAGAGVVACVVASPWYFAMYARFGDSFLGAHFGREIAERARGERFGVDPWWWYWWWLWRAYKPWVWLLLATPAAMVLRRRFPARHPAGQEVQSLALPLVWSAGWLVLLSCFPDKRTAYAMPVYLSLAWVCGVVMVRLFPALHAPRLVAAGLVTGCVLVAGSVGATVYLARRGPVGEGAALAAVARGLRGADPRHVWSGALRHADAANVYIAAGCWPRRSMNDGELDIAPSAPRYEDAAYVPEAAGGDLVVYRDGGGAVPPVGAFVVVRAEPFTVVRWP
ncbi:MAG: glycosyltransferase family 39 protein [Phycisphaerales bacterium]